MAGQLLRYFWWLTGINKGSDALRHFGTTVPFYESVVDCLMPKVFFAVCWLCIELEGFQTS